MKELEELYETVDFEYLKSWIWKYYENITRVPAKI